MAQTIKIKRGGLASLVASTPTLAQGELLLATGSLNGLGSSLFVADSTNSPELPYAKIESIANGATLASSLDDNFTGLLIHSASDNKLYRYNGTTFVELPIAAGSFEGILPILNGGTGQDALDDIVGDGKVIVQNGTETIIGGDTVLTLGGGVVTGSAQINGSGINENTIGFTYSGGGISGGTSAALGGVAIELTVTTGSIAENGTNLVDAGTLFTLSSSIATDITNNTGNVEGVTGQVAYFDDTNSVSGSSGFTFASDVLTVGTSTFGTNTTIEGDLTVNGTTTTINSTTVNIDDNIIVVNYGGSAATAGIHAIDATGVTTATGSLVWDGNNTKDWWKAGPKGSEKRVVTFNDNGGGTDTAIQRLDSDSHLVDSSLTDDGTTVTVASNVDLTLQGTGQLTVPEAVLFTGLTVTDSGAATDEVLFVQTDGTVGQIDSSATTDEMVGILGYKSSGGMTFSTLIDGGTF